MHMFLTFLMKAHKAHWTSTSFHPASGVFYTSKGEGGIYSTNDNNCSVIIHLFIHIADNFGRQFNLAVWQIDESTAKLYSAYILSCHLYLVCGVCKLQE